MKEDSALREQICQLATDGKVACKALLELASRAGCQPGRIGRLCDEMNIRICACQLGCFK